MKVFIIGASGLIGGNCMTCMRRDPDMDVIGSHFSFATLDTEYFNVFDPQAATFDLNAFAPDVILHTGALTHVDYCETHPDESYRHNVGSTRAVIELAEKFKSKLIFISTDYVFDGKNGPYAETDPVNPLSVYGKHKLEAENLIREKYADHVIIRVTNVYGHEIRGKNFVSFLIREARKCEEKTLRLPVDQFATPVNAFDVGALICAMIKDKKTGTYHLASDEYLSRVELAEKVLSFFPGSPLRIEGVPTRDLGQAAPRPLRGGLKTAKIRNEYPGFTFSTLHDFLEEHDGF